MTIQQIFEEMDQTIEKFDKETKAIFADWKKETDKIVDDYHKKVYDIEQKHKELMQKIGVKPVIVNLIYSEQEDKTK